MTLLLLSMGQVLLFAQDLPGLLWPVLILRVGLMAVMLPALVMQFWTDLHLGWHLPIVLLTWALLLGYEQAWSALCRLRTAMDLPARPGRRAFLAGTGVAAATGCGVVSCYPAPGITRRSLPLRDLPSALVGKRVVLLSDLHRGPAIGRDYLESVVAMVNSLRPDIVLLPGDFVSNSSAYYADVTAVLSKLTPRIASIATLGNHDHYEGAEQAKLALTRAGVVLLQNRSIHVSSDGRLSAFGTRGLCLAGVDDLTAGKPDLVAALAGVDAAVPRILLSHNPDLAEEDYAKACSDRIDLQVSGHTHGGQVVLPGAGPLISGSRYGTKYLSGWVEGPRWPVFVTRGVGASVLPVRVGAPPEIALFELSRWPRRGRDTKQIARVCKISTPC